MAETEMQKSQSVQQTAGADLEPKKQGKIYHNYWLLSEVSTQ